MKTHNQKFTAVFLTLAVIGSLLFSLFGPLNQPQKAKASWFSPDWSYRQKIIIDHTKVPNTDQTDFPVLIKITDTNNPIFSSKVQDDGDDIRFTNTDQTTTLNHEIESYSKSTHELWAWVKVPTLSHENDTTIYLYYGNQSVEAPTTASKQAVWSNGYVAVYHMQGSGDLSDSTSHGYTATSYTLTPGAGRIGSARTFNGSSYGLIGNPSELALTSDSQFSISAWYNVTNTTSARSVVSCRNASNPLVFFQAGAGETITYGATTISAAEASTASTSQTSGTWNYGAMTFSGRTMTGVLNNTSVVANPMTGTNKTLISGRWMIGRQDSGDPRWFLGSTDEIRISNVARSTDWIATEYANQNSPETFFQIRSEANQALAPLQAGPAGWYDIEWNARQPISLNPTLNKVPSTNQTDFPVLVKITDINNNLWGRAQADGDDILFASGDGTTKLAHEIEKYDNVTHELWAWVKVPTLATGADTTIYMYYGNALSSNQQSKTAVWSNGYAGVWHLGETSNPYVDSTANNNSSSAGTNPLKVAGQVGDGQLLTQSSAQSISIPSVTSLNPTSFITLQSWFKPIAAAAPYMIFSKRNEQQWRAFVEDNTGKTYVNITIGGMTHSLGPVSATMGSWNKLALTYDGSSIRLFLNGSPVGDPVLATGLIATSSDPLQFGVQLSSYFYNGFMDDSNLSSTARSADWIATEYNNQNSPETFMSFGDFETADSYAPSNPSTITSLNGSGGEPLGTAGNDSTPYYSWPEPEVAGGATDQTGQYISGVSGYYSYFGTDCAIDGVGGADPTMTRGVLSDTGSGLHYSSDTSISVPDLTTNQDRYCLRMRTRDIAGNISALSPTTEVATYNFDLTNPLPPTFISVNPAGYSATDSFEFSWPAAVDVTGDGISGLAGYQYMRGGTSGDAWSATQTATKVSSITSYQEGANIFILRSVDNAGNTSADIQTSYYYSANPPAKPTSLIVDPELSDQNSFSFSWTAPVHSRPIVDYGYSINIAPNANNINWTGTAATTLAADHFATQQGINTFYLIARDDAGAYSFAPAAVAEVSFNCTTPAPVIPSSVSVSDSSNRAISLWALTLKWSKGEGQDGTSFDHYSIERSLDGDTFSEISTTRSEAFIDSTGLSNSQPYYYRVKAIDNAGSASAASQVVSKTPTGKYTSPPSVVLEPAVSAKATTATIGWVVNRPSTSAIRFGKSQSDLSRSQVDPVAKTSQSISLVGLEPATTYYYQVQSLDDFRDYPSESAYLYLRSFTTLAPPSISKVEVSNITLASADISWDTSSASNTKAYFGTSISYISALPESSSSMTTKHTVKLTGLSHTTKYHFKIAGSDIDDNPLSSDDYTFETLPMPVISAIDYQTDASGPEPAMVITWNTNVPTSSSVEYTPKNSADQLVFEESQSALVSKHRVSLSHLEDNTDYQFILTGNDQFGNRVKSDEQSMKTSMDKRPAKITGITIETSNVGLDKQDKAQIAVSWKTDEPATSMVEFSGGITGGEYTSKTTEDKAFTTNHLVIIPDLSPTSPYHIRVVSTDKGENISRSDDHTVVPGDVPRSALQLILQTFTRLFGWLGL